MNVEINNSFIRDAKKAPKQIQQALPEIIQTLRESKTLIEIKKLKKMVGYANAYRIRIGDYRLGGYLEGETIVLSRLLSRKEIYRFFPK